MILLLAAQASTRPPAIGLCALDEAVYFSCQVRGSRTISVCGAEQGWTYRFGKPGAVELTLPEPGGPSATHSETRHGEDSARYTALFQSKTHHYTIEVERTEDQFGASLVVSQAAKTVSTLPCVGPVQGDFTTWSTQGSGKWVGTWRNPTAELVISNADEGLTLVGSATWHGAMPGQVHTGEVNGPLKPHDLEGLTFQKGDCGLRLLPTDGASLEVVETGTCGGLNVSFSGTYQRIP